MGLTPPQDAHDTSRPEPAGSHRRVGAVEDADLLVRWQAGDRDAGGRLVRKYHASIAGFLGASVGDAERQDLTQRTFERITRGKSDFRGECSVRSYFFRVARGVLVDHLRRRHRKSFDPLTHSIEDLGGATPSRMIVELSRTRKLLMCMRALPLDTKQLLELYYWEGCTAAELSVVFDVREGTIRRRVFDAKTRLRACMCGEHAQVEGDEMALEQLLRELGSLLMAGPRGG